MLPPVDIKQLFSLMANNTSARSLVEFLCTTRASFESWFRVELVPVLIQMGIPYPAISPDYTFLDGGKADLCIRSENNVVLFELKSFVAGQDSNKKNKYPHQITRLLDHLSKSSNISQVITFTTFNGYSENKMNTF